MRSHARSLTAGRVQGLSRYSSSSLASGPRPHLEVHLQSGEKPKLTHRASMQDGTQCTPYLSNTSVQNMGVLSLLGQGSLFSAPAQTPPGGGYIHPAQHMFSPPLTPLRTQAHTVITLQGPPLSPNLELTGAPCLPKDWPMNKSLNNMPSNLSGT